jgi:lipid A 3-O-deacylase
MRGLAGRVAVLLLSIAFSSGAASAQTFVDDVFLSVGHGARHVETYRLGVRNDFDGALFRSRVGCLSGYAEVGLIHWRNDPEAVYGGVLAPVVAYYFGSESNAVRPYVGGGIGVAYLSDTRIDGRDLSTRFQFEDRVGIGFVSNRLNAYLAYVHYSNASVKAPNDGIDALMLTVGWALR